MASERIERVIRHLAPSPCAAGIAETSTHSSTNDNTFSKEDGMKAAGSVKVASTEAELRVQLAVAYRIISHFGWDDGIQNHLTVRIPGADNQYLINSYGMGFDEVTASSLVKIDHEGNVIHPGSIAGTVNLAGFNIHGAIHKSRHDALCVMHTHEPSTAAVASMKCGFLPGMSQHAMLIGSVPIHKYELTTGPSGPEGCQKMADDFGQTARSILLENHGVIVTGETIPEAMMRLFYITKACDIQVKALAGQQGLSAVNMVTEMSKLGAMEHGGQLFMAGIGGHEFAHWSRIIDRVNPGYNDL